MILSMVSDCRPSVVVVVGGPPLDVIDVLARSNASQRERVALAALQSGNRRREIALISVVTALM